MNDKYKEYFRIEERPNGGGTIFGFFELYSFLSNFHPCTVMYDGETYGSVEHAYQALKSPKKSVRLAFMEPSMTAGQAKKAGRQLEEIREDWEEVKYDIMVRLVFDKFARSRSLRRWLLNTENKILIEANHWGDNTWGQDYRADVGNNWLGKILMKVRELLKFPYEVVS